MTSRSSPSAAPRRRTAAGSRGRSACARRRPTAAGVGSALGLLEGNETFELARTALMRLDHPEAAERASAILEALEREALATVGESWRSEARRPPHGRPPLRGPGLRARGAARRRREPSRLADAFNEHYARAYGYREELPVEAVTWYLTLVRPARASAAAASRPRRGPRGPEGRSRGVLPGDGARSRCPWSTGVRSSPGVTLHGPLLVEETHTTTVVLPGDSLRVDPNLALVIDVEATRCRLTR